MDIVLPSESLRSPVARFSNEPSRCAPANSLILKWLLATQQH